MSKLFFFFTFVLARANSLAIGLGGIGGPKGNGFKSRHGKLNMYDSFGSTIICFGCTEMRPRELAKRGPRESTL